MKFEYTKNHSFKLIAENQKDRDYLEKYCNPITAFAWSRSRSSANKDYEHSTDFKRIMIAVQLSITDELDFDCYVDNITYKTKLNSVIKQINKMVDKANK